MTNDEGERTFVIRPSSFFRHSSFDIRHSLYRLAVVFTIACVPGCFKHTPPDFGKLIGKEAENKKENAGPKTLGVVGKNLGESEGVSVAPLELAARVVELHKSDKTAMATAWIQRHPEAALEALRFADKSTSDQAYTLLAEVHDRHTCLPGHSAWHETAALRKRNRAPFDAYAELRKTFQTCMTEGHVDRALDLDLLDKAEATGSPMPPLEARQLQGAALLLADRPQEAAETFTIAAQDALEISPYQAAYLLLLESDAERRAGAAPAASQTWQRAVVLAGKLIANQPPVLDPVLWERLGYLRPADMPWPADVIALLAEHDPLAGLTAPQLDATLASDDGADPADSEAIVWHSIGRWYLDRGHAQAALVSFKRAEAATTAPEAGQWLRLRQAKALAQLDQSGPATAILASLLADKKSSVRRPASAMLGSIYLQRNQYPKGLGLLKQAVDEDDGLEWAERSQAEADLALAYLTIGDAAKGLDRLHRAQRRFESEQNRELLVVSLENEEKFLNHLGKRKDASAIRERLRQIEQDW